MEYRKLGDTELEISAITFGAWAIGGWMWGGADEADAIAAIQKAMELGVTTIDTAAVYGFGRSEEIVRKAIADRRDEVQILTKFGLRWDRPEGTLRFDTFDLEGRPLRIMRNGRADSVIEECERSLKRLGTDHIDLYQQHWPDPSTEIEETYSAIDKLLKDGKILAAGVSNFSVEQMQQVHKIIPLASSQPPYSMVNRGAEADVLPYCRENNIGVIVYSPLQRGLLTGKITMDYKFNEGDHRSENAFFAPANRKRILEMLAKLQPIASAYDMTLTQLILHWTIHREGITAALVGARNPLQAEENALACEFAISAEDMQRIDEIADEVHLEV